MKSRNTELRGGRPSGRRRHTEETLIASEARLAEAQRIARVGSWEWDIDSDRLWWSEETFRIFGLDPEKFSADFDAFIGAVHPDDRQLVRESVAQAVRDQVSEWTIDYRSILPGGEIRYLHENARAVFAPDGRLVKRVGTVQDITERKLADQALRESEQRYRQVFENSPVSIWEEDFSQVKTLFDRLKKEGVTDIETYFDQHPQSVRQCAELAGIVDVNQAALHLHGARSKAELFAGLVNTFTPESFATFRRELVCLWNGETGMVENAVVKTLAGEPRQVTVYFSVCPGHERTLARVIVSLVDITERKRAEEKALRSEQRLRLHREQSSLGFLEWDENFCAVEWNTACERIFGYTREEAIGRHAKDLILPVEVHALVDGIYQSLMDQTVGQHSINENVTKDGRTIICEWFNTPLIDKDGKAVGVASVCNDITAQQRMERLAQARLRMVETAHTAGITLDDILRRMLDEIETQTGSRIGFYHFLAEDQQTISLQSWSTNTVSAMCATEGKGRHYPVAEAGVWADCVREGRPVIHNDYASLPRRQSLPAGHAPIVRELVVPVFRGPRIVAIIGVGNKPEVYTETDVQIASLLGDFSWEIVIRKLAEKSLRQSEARLTEAQRIARLGNWELDLTSNILLWSDEIYRIFEIDPARFGTSYEAFLDAIHPDDREMVNHAYTRSVADRIPYAITHRLLMKDGRIKYVEERCETSYDEDGRPLRSMGTVHDVTDRKLAEEEVLALNQQLERRVAERTAELEAKNLELERINQLFVGRELKMVELKKRLKKFEGER